MPLSEASLTYAVIRPIYQNAYIMKYLCLTLLLLGACSSDPGDNKSDGTDAAETRNPNGRSPGMAGEVPGVDASPMPADTSPNTVDGGAADTMSADAGDTGTPKSDATTTDTTPAPAPDMQAPEPVCPRQNPCTAGEVRCNQNAVESCDLVINGCTQWTTHDCGVMVCDPTEKRCKCGINCAPGETRCSSAGLMEVCSIVNSCPAWLPKPCTGAKVCVISAGKAVCG